MLTMLKQTIASETTKNALNWITSWWTQQETPAAKAYAKQTTRDTVESVPATIDALEAAIGAYDNKNTGLNVETAWAMGEIIVNHESVRDLLLTPAKARHHYKNYQFLKGEFQGEVDQTEDEQEDFVVINIKP